MKFENIHEILAFSRNNSSLVNYNHMMRVKEFSRRILEELKELLIFTKEQEFILFSSAALHDIGKCLDKKEHPKYSKDMILTSPELMIIPPRMKKLIGIAVESHRKTIAEELWTLDKNEQDGVLKVIAILRMADALGKSENRRLELLDCEVTEDNIVVILNASLVEKDYISLKKKSRLFEEVYNKKLIVIYKLSYLLR